VKRAIRKYAKDFAAIIGLFVLAGAVSAYILDNQRLTLPSWVPVVGKDFFTIEAELSNAQAVTPGQGQTVNVAGVRVGDISEVRLENGKAILTLNLEERYRGRVRAGATGLLRPKTGLRDMVLQLDPGTSGAVLEEGARIPINQTLPDVNLDEILATLDGDTRQYLQLLLGEAEAGLRGNDKNLADVIRRFEPTARDLRRINEGLAERRTNIKRVMHNFSLLAEELGAKDDEIAEFVENSEAVFATLAGSDQDLRATLRELPSALTATRSALGKSEALARELQPSLTALRPAARALGPALRQTRPFLRQSTPIIRDKVRPLVRAANPLVAELRPTMRDLAAAAPDLTQSLDQLNYIFDLLAYNPPGEEEGYLFWASWVNHAGATIFKIQDAHGPIRRALFTASCNALEIVDNVAQVNPALGVIITLLNPVRDSALCPSQQPTARTAAKKGAAATDGAASTTRESGGAR
jgi:phospholipid/cholesterol/gamma-HCH transport system substrate-binding protein